MKSRSGFSLVELVVFILVFAIAMTAMVVAFNTVLIRSNETGQNIQASYLAQARINILLLTKQSYGLTFSSPNWTLIDPCVSPGTASACTALSAYANSINLTPSSSLSNDSTGTTVTMTVTGDGRATEVIRFTP